MAQLSDQLDEHAPLSGVGAFQGLIEQQHFRIRQQALGELEPLAHASAIGPDRPAGLSGERNLFESFFGRLSGIGQAIEAGAQLEEFAPAHEIIELVLLRTVAQPPVELRVPAQILTEEFDLAGAGRQQTGHQLEQGRLARAVRAQQPGYARC